MKKYPSQERLKELFDYHPDGYLVWKYRPEQRSCVNSRFEGKKAGSSGLTKNLKSFNEVRLNGRLYKVSELIWIYHNGDIPEGMSVISNNSENIKISELKISHKNDRTGIQQASRLQGGYIGVSERSGHYVAVYGGRYLGTFKSEIAAAACVDDAVLKKHGGGSFLNLKSAIDYEAERVVARVVQKKKRQNGRMQGCYFDSRKKKPWYSKLNKLYLGSFKTEIEAARAYNIAAYEHYGEDAVLNDIPDPLGKGDIF